MTSIAGKIGCTAETLCRWCHEEASRRSGPAAQAVVDREPLKLLESCSKMPRLGSRFTLHPMKAFASTSSLRAWRPNRILFSKP